MTFIILSAIMYLQGKEREDIKMFEVIINGKTVIETNKREEAEAVFNFYRAEKKLFNIHEIIFMNPELLEFFEG